MIIGTVACITIGAIGYCVGWVRGSLVTGREVTLRSRYGK